MSDLNGGADRIPRDMLRIAVAPTRTDADALRPERVATPRPNAGEILLRVAAAGVNRMDLLQRRGLYPLPPGTPDTLGVEVAGTVVATGTGVERWRLGDRVCALLAGGGYAEYVAFDARQAMAIPPGLDLVAAASLPETVITVWQNVFDRSGLRAGETLLVHGGTSGIGVAAIAMARAAGARVITTGRGAAKAAAARALGATLAINSSAEDWIAAVERDGGADVVLEMVGGTSLAGDIAVLKPDGRLALIALQGGAEASLDLTAVLLKRLTLTGSTLRARPTAEKARLARAVEATVWPWIASGAFKPLIDQVFPLADAAAAHRRLENGDVVGKIVLTVEG